VLTTLLNALLDIGSDIIMLLERITFMMNSEYELINKLVADGVRKRFPLSEGFHSCILLLNHLVMLLLET